MTTIPTMFLLVGAFMKKGEPQEEYKPTIQEAKDLDVALRALEPKIINGKKQYPFEQYCAEQGYISFLPNGQIQVKSAFNWGRAIKVYDLMKWWRGIELEKIFDQFPEERTAYDQKIQAISREIREMLEGKLAVN